MKLHFEVCFQFEFFDFELYCRFLCICSLDFSVAKIIFIKTFIRFNARIRFFNNFLKLPNFYNGKHFSLFQYENNFISNCYTEFIDNVHKTLLPEGFSYYLIKYN